MIYENIKDPHIRHLLRLPPDDAVERKVAETVETLQKHFPDTKLIVPEIVYDLKGHTAGMANKSKIRINVDLLYTEHYDDMIQSTVPHEVCHVVQRQLYPASKSHGYEWTRLMLLLGLPPERCHSYDTTPARKRTPMKRPYVYTCECRTHAMTQIVHRRIKSGKDYVCRDCRQPLIFSHTKPY